MHFFLILLLISLLVPLQGQTILSGRVLDEREAPIPFANVYLDSIWDGTASDEKGVFHFTTQAKGPVTLVVSSLGWEERRRPIHITGDSLWISLTLKPNSTALKEVVITAGSFDAAASESATLLNPLDIVQNPIAAGDLNGALRTLPSVSIVGDQTGIFVRGGEAYETQVIIDGTTVAEPFFGTSPDIPARNRFDPFLFEGIQFSTGGYSAEFGQALASVLELNTEDMPSSSSIGLGANLAGVSTSLSKEWNKRTAVLAQAAYTNLTPLFELVPQDREWEQVPTVVEGALGFRRKTDKGIFKGYGQWQQQEFALSYPRIGETSLTNRFENNNSNFYGYLTYNGLLGTKGTIYAGFTQSTELEDIQLNEDTIRNDISFQQARLKWGRSLGKKAQLRTGLEWR